MLSHQIRIKRKLSPRFLVLLTLLFLYGSLYYLYQVEISPSNLYLGFRFRELGWFELASSIFLFVLPTTFLPVYISRPSDLGIWSLYLFSYSPTAFMAFHVGKMESLDAIWLLIVMACALFTVAFFRKFKMNSSTSIMINWHRLDRFFLFLVFVLTMLYVAYLGNFSIRVDVANIYERRLAARETIGLGSGYILSASRSILTILAVYLMVVKKKSIYFVFISVIVLFIFSLDGTKGTILNLLFLTVLLFIVKQYRTILFLPLALLCLTIFGALEFNISNTNIINQYLVRRILIVPGFLNTAFWEFFSSHDKMLLTDSIGNYFFEKVYDVSAAHLIGLEYFQDSNANANTGIWMGGFAHFGLIGVFFMSLLAAFLFGLIDNLLKTRFFLLGVAICTYMGILWSEQMMHTSFLTGGVFYIIFFVFLIICSKHLKLEFLQNEPHPR